MPRNGNVPGIRVGAVCAVAARPRPVRSLLGVYTFISPLRLAQVRPDKNRSKPVSTYLFTFRAPEDYAPASDTFDAWASWQLELGARLKDRGNVATAAAALGASAADTTLGGNAIKLAPQLLKRQYQPT
jgi:hypothetical protein